MTLAFPQGKKTSSLDCCTSVIDLTVTISVVLFQGETIMFGKDQDGQHFFLHENGTKEDVDIVMEDPLIISKDGSQYFIGETKIFHIPGPSATSCQESDQSLEHPPLQNNGVQPDNESKRNPIFSEQACYTKQVRVTKFLFKLDVQKLVSAVQAAIGNVPSILTAVQSFGTSYDSRAQQEEFQKMEYIAQEHKRVVVIIQQESTLKGWQAWAFGWLFSRVQFDCKFCYIRAAADSPQAIQAVRNIGPRVSDLLQYYQVHLEADKGAG